MQQRYYKHPDGVFRVPALFHWEYVVTAAPEEILSFKEGTLQTDYTIGPEIKKNHYHACLRHEIVHASDDVLALESKGEFSRFYWITIVEWKLLHVLPNIIQIVARTSDRLFVGLPLWKEQEYFDLNIDYTATILIRPNNRVTPWLPQTNSIFGPFISTRKSSVRHALMFLGPIIADRLEKEKEYGHDLPERPVLPPSFQNDLISWLLDLAVGEERTVPDLTLRILATNMAAIHTTSQTLTTALYDLTTYPEHLIPMCEEAKRVIDRLLRETQRLNIISPVAMGRKVAAKEGFTFSDGTTIPFFAATELKAMLAHILINYNVKAETEGSRPPDDRFGVLRMPNLRGKIWICKRAV
ncbi:cytochrome P450 [Mycena leptocephala]|nr:cytochrome P450 [Mycena leptocephala]